MDISCCKALTACKKSKNIIEHERNWMNSGVPSLHFSQRALNGLCHHLFPLDALVDPDLLQLSLALRARGAQKPQAAARSKTATRRSMRI